MSSYRVLWTQNITIAYFKVKLPKKTRMQSLVCAQCPGEAAGKAESQMLRIYGTVEGERRRTIRRMCAAC